MKALVEFGFFGDGELMKGFLATGLGFDEEFLVGVEVEARVKGVVGGVRDERVELVSVADHDAEIRHLFGTIIVE